MHDPRESHLAFLKRILRYVKGTLSFSLRIGSGPVDSLTAYSDVDWAGCPDSYRSTSGYRVFLGDTLISWSSIGMDSDVWKSELSAFVSAKNVNMDIRIRIRF
jgi:hypothetical protein